MNCANHPDRERAAFCQNCGKPLCAECMRTYGTSIFCEQCLAARMGTTAPPPAGAGVPYPGYTNPGYSGGSYTYPGYVAPGSIPQPPPPGTPSPGLAALLGFIPGVGAMYNGQYAKGFVHLIVFAVLTSLADQHDIFGWFVAGWICYMVVEAHQTAKARLEGTPLPNPFGLNDIGERLGFGRSWPGHHPYGTPGAEPQAAPGPATAGPGAANVPPANPYAAPQSYGYTYVPPMSDWGAPMDSGYGVPPVPVVEEPHHRRLPTGAIWLIGLGAIFLLSDTGIFRFYPMHNFGPFILIAVGVWVFVRKMTKTGGSLENDGTPFYHWRLTRAFCSAMWIVLTGVIWMLDELHIISWAHSWPIYMIAWGVMTLFRHTAAGYGPPPYGGPVPPPVNPVPPVTSTEIIPATPQTHADHNDQEGR